MRQGIQAHQEGTGHIETTVPVNWLERATNNRRESSVTKKNINVKAAAKIVKEKKVPQRKVSLTIYPIYDVYYTEDNRMGIAWADVVLK